MAEGNRASTQSASTSADSSAHVNNNDRHLIRQLFLLNRETSSSIINKFILYCYIPVGLFLFILRSFMGVHIFIAASILPKGTVLRCVVLRIMLSVMGLLVTTESSEKKRCAQNALVIVSNHVSIVDHLAISLIQPCVVPSVWNIPTLLRWCLGYEDMGIGEGREELLKRTKQFINNDSNRNISVLTFPEGAMTSGRKGLLKFSSWPFEVSNRVQPVTITIYRPLLTNIAHSILGAAWWQDLFYFLFVPVTIFKIKWLSPVERKMKCKEDGSDETSDEYANRVAALMADKLGLISTPYTCYDAVDEAKRFLNESKQHTTNANGNTSAPQATKFRRSNKHLSNAQLDSITMRIKQAYPAIPLHIIRDDLDLTNDANVTCERIISGLLTSNSSGNKHSSSANNSVYAFANNNLNEWRKGFTYRRWNMIEVNRKIYLDRINDQTN